MTTPDDQRWWPPHPAPRGFRAHTHRYTFGLAHSQPRVWRWLTDPDTFSTAARWPWRVEFVGGGFETGVLAAHHGPGMNFAGILAEIRPPDYRDLRYFYGSYALTRSLARPTRLQFWLRDTGTERRAECEVTLQVDAWVRRWIAPAVTAVQRLFWPSFARGARRSLDRA